MGERAKREPEPGIAASRRFSDTNANAARPRARIVRTSSDDEFEHVRVAFDPQELMFAEVSARVLLHTRSCSAVRAYIDSALAK